MAGRQRIDRVRRQYNQWVANQTLEDYALRFTAKSARRWSAARVANTALGAISFLALEAIGGTITLNYGVTNATAAILVVSVIIFCLRTADCLSRRQMRHRHRPADPRRRLRLYRLDHHVADLRLLHLHLLRDRGGHPRQRAGDVLRHPAADRLSHQRRRHHSAGHVRHHPDQPLPAVDAAALDRPAHPPLRRDRLRQPAVVRGVDASSPASTATPAAHLDLLLFGTAASVVFSLVAQIGEQVDFLRFLPRDRRTSRTSWWIALLSAGPGWIIFGALKLLAGLVPRLLRAQPRRFHRACRRARAHVSRSVPLRAVAARSGAGADRHLRRSCRRSRSTSPTPMPARSPGRTSSRA